RRSVAAMASPCQRSSATELHSKVGSYHPADYISSGVAAHSFCRLLTQHWEDSFAAGNGRVAERCKSCCLISLFIVGRQSYRSYPRAQRHEHLLLSRNIRCLTKTFAWAFCGVEVFRSNALPANGGAEFFLSCPAA